MIERLSAFGPKSPSSPPHDNIPVTEDTIPVTEDKISVAEDKIAVSVPQFGLSVASNDREALCAREPLC
jgi:hypothetical protein